MTVTRWTLQNIADAQAAQRKWKVPTSVSIGQYGLESEWGKAIPADHVTHETSNNPFGIKALTGQAFVTSPTHEEVHGQMVPVLANFRKFASLSEAFDAHAQLLATAPIYAPAMAALPNLAAFVALMGAKYATDSAYAKDLLNLIEVDGLARFDALPALPPVPILAPPAPAAAPQPAPPPAPPSPPAPPPAVGAWAGLWSHAMSWFSQFAQSLIAGVEGAPPVPAPTHPNQAPLNSALQSLNNAGAAVGAAVKGAATTSVDGFLTTQIGPVGTEFVDIALQALISEATSRLSSSAAGTKAAAG